MKYENLAKNITKDYIEEILSNQNLDTIKIIEVIISSLQYIDDLKWLENLCLRFINYDDFWVQKNCINGLGDLVRVYGKLNNLNLINSTIDKIERENSKLSGEIRNLRDDIKIFLKVDTKNYD